MTAVAFFVLLLCLVSISHAWVCLEAPMLTKAQQIEAGAGHVHAVNAYGRGYFLNGQQWSALHLTQIKYLTSGSTGTWALSSRHQLYKVIGGNFTRVPGLTLTQVDAGGYGFLVGSTGGQAHCLQSFYADRFKGVGSVVWKSLGSYAFKHFSCGLYGCWGVDTSGRMYHAKSITSACHASGWRYISNGMVMVEASSDGLVFALTTSGQVWQRSGVSASRTHGLNWVNVPMCVAIKHLSYDLGKLWVISKSGFIMFCTH